MNAGSSLRLDDPTLPRSFDALCERAVRGELGEDPADLVVSVAFVTSQGSQHAGRATAYRNEVLSVRVGAAVGSCGVEPGELAGSADVAQVVDDCVAAPVRALLEHPVVPVRVAALDAYLMHLHPHPAAGGVPVVVPAGSSLAKSRARARSVVDMLPVPVGGTVLVVGVVNSLLAQLREHSRGYVPCDLAGGRTEWGEPVRTDAIAHLDECDALLVTGMTLGNGTFDPLLARARLAGLPVVMFAQSGSAVLPWFVGPSGLHAVSAEPFPFFSLGGAASTVFHYRAADVA